MDSLEDQDSVSVDYINKEVQQKKNSYVENEFDTQKLLTDVKLRENVIAHPNILLYVLIIVIVLLICIIAVLIYVLQVKPCYVKRRTRSTLVPTEDQELKIFKSQIVEPLYPSDRLSTVKA